MKVRKGFVSNSSSSSFIIQNCDLIDYFNITKKDIVDSIKHLLGNCEYKDCFYVYDLKDICDYIIIPRIDNYYTFNLSLIYLLLYVDLFLYAHLFLFFVL